MIYRWDVINHLIKKNNYTSYIELGYYKGWSFDRIGNEFTEKHAVDPNPCQTTDQQAWEYGRVEDISDYMDGRRHYIHKMTSDEWFSQLHPNQKYDIFFIDGLHESQQVDRDIQNALKYLSEGGTIVLHDCNPSSYEMTTTGTALGEWTGDVYKSFWKFRDTITGYDSYVVDTDYGVGIIKRNPLMLEGRIITDSLYTWEYFTAHRNAVLNIISPKEFLEREKIVTKVPGVDSSQVIPSEPFKAPFLP